MKIQPAIAAIACSIALLSCRGDSQLAAVEPVVAAENAMQRFAAMIGELNLEQRANLFAVEQLYHVANGDGDFDNYRSSNWSHTEWEIVGRPRFDYQIYPNTQDLPEDDAILIATPREIRISNGVFLRVALTHSLKIIRLKDDEFHQLILNQTGVMKP